MLNFFLICNVLTVRLQVPDGKEYVFDSGQALRGLIRASQRWNKFALFAIKTADYIYNYIEKNGKIPAVYGKEIPEYVNIYILPALFEAGKLFNKLEYINKARKSIVYYKGVTDVLNRNCLSHFLAYIIDGFIDMGETDLSVAM